METVACGVEWYSIGCLTKAAQSLIGLVPWIALIWAIYAFFSKRRDDRLASQRLERQGLYLELVELVHTLRRSHVRKEDVELWGYFMIMEKVRFVFPNEIPSVFHNHSMALNYYLRTDGDDELFDEMRSSEGAVFDQLLSVLREDLGMPTSIQGAPVGPPMD
jgi:hypothetical protein